MKRIRVESRKKPLQFVRKLFRQERRLPHPSKTQRGQVMVIFIVSFIALLGFAGIVTDAGSVYVTYTQLKRAVDSAAVAAANNIKNPADSYATRKTRITEAAREMIDIHNIADITTLQVFTCDDSGVPGEFVEACPGAGEMPRKLAWVQATQAAPVYFLRLFGFTNVPLTVRSGVHW